MRSPYRWRLLLALGLSCPAFVQAQPAPPSLVDASAADGAPSDTIDGGVVSDAGIDASPAPPPTAPPPPPEAAPPPPAAKLASSPVEVTVVGTRVARTAGSAHILKNKQLERFEYDDPHAVLAAVPGVYSRGEDGVGLRPNIGLRGVNPDRSKKVTLLEDGILFGPAPYSAPAAYYFPLMTRMTQVRVLKGPGSISYGPQTVAGAIDLGTRGIGQGRAASLDVALGSYGYGKAHGFVSSGEGKLRFLLEGVHVRDGGFKELPSGEDTGFSHNEWMLKTVYAFDPTPRARNELQLKLTYSDEQSNETYLGLTDADFHANPNARYQPSHLDHMRWYRTSAVLSHTLEHSSGLTLKTSVYRHDFFRVWRKVNGFRGASLFDVLERPNDPRNAVYYNLLAGRGESAIAQESLLIGPNQREFVSQGIESRLRWNGQTGPIEHRLEAGLRLHHDSIDRYHTQDGFLVRTGGALAHEASPTEVTAWQEAWTVATAFHLIDALTWKRLTITPGVRVEILRQGYNDRLADSHQRAWVAEVLPGIGLYQGLTDHFGLLAGIHRGFSPPVPDSAPNGRSELSINYEGGARYVRGGFHAEVIGYYNDYSNLTDVCTLSSGCVVTNLDRQFDAGEARIYGAELYLEHEIPIGARMRVPFGFAYTLTKTEFLNDFNSEDPIFGRVRAGDEIPYIPLHQAHLTLGLETARASVVLGLTYVAQMREQAGSQPLFQALATDEQVVVDMGATLKLWGPVAIYANVRNLFDGRYIVSRRPFGARPNAPRWIQAGVKATF